MTHNAVKAIVDFYASTGSWMSKVIFAKGAILGTLATVSIGFIIAFVVASGKDEVACTTPAQVSLDVVETFHVVEPDGYECPHFRVPADYDYSKNTHEVYALLARDPLHASEHGELSATIHGTRVVFEIDREYHGVYQKERAEYHLQSVSNLIPKAVPSHPSDGTPDGPSPWLIYTGGAMGSGKGRTMRWLRMNGYFPVPDVVVVDQDAIRQCFPEFQGYVRRDPYTAGWRTQRESGLVAELTYQAAMTMQRHVVVDGSLSNIEWYKALIPKLRSRFPRYRVGVVFVTAPREEIILRVERRAKITGRMVPLQEIDRSVAAGERVHELGPLVDFLAFFTNADGQDPKLESIVNAREEGTLEKFRELLREKTQATI